MQRETMLGGTPRDLAREREERPRERRERAMERARSSGREEGSAAASRWRRFLRRVSKMG